jgi:hypothetical protein
MAFGTPLRELPTLPALGARIVDAEGKPTPEFDRFMRRLMDWAAAAQAALKELEP